MEIRRVQITGLMVVFLTSLVLGNGIVAQDAVVKKLAGDFKFTEGPAADKDGNVFFTDIPNSRIHKWSVEGTLSTFLENSRQANGLYFDKDGNLIACAGGTGQIIAIDPAGTITVLADTFEGKPFNSPNDLWIDPAGGIYFTDPRYGLRDNLPQGGEHVYYLSPDRKRVIRVIDEMVRPNGVIGTADGKLYVADHGADQTFVYTINPDGTLSEKRLFVPQGADGMTMDERGNVYLTGEAVTVYDANGQLIQTIAVPERPSNVTFGGKDNKTLFITARTSLYSLEMQVAGAKKVVKP
jgi:gluconolactonase